MNDEKRKPAGGNGGQRARAPCGALGQPQYSTDCPTRQALIQCEQCGAFERIPGAEATRRLDESGRLLCTACFEGPINTAAGGPIHWAIVDSLHAFLTELERKRIVEPYDDATWHCLRRAYRRMRYASYLTIEDRLAWEVAGDG